MIRSKMFWSVQVALWLGFALLTRFTWIDVHPPSWLWIGTYMFLGFLSSTLLAATFENLHNKTRILQICLSILISIVVGLAWRAAFNALEYHLLESANNQFKFWGYFHNGKSAVMQLLIWSAGYWLLIYHLLMEQQREVERKLALDAKEAKLKMLQYQITPHFLFNVLSGLDTLMLKGDTTNARSMLQKLSDYLRYTLQAESGATQSLENEIAHCQRYLEIERLRFKDKLLVNWQIPETLPECSMPSGVLLPLFENALKHGSLSASEPTNIEVKLHSYDGQVIFEVHNTVSDTSPSEGFGIGLSNTKDRLKSFFGEKVSFSAQRAGHKFIAHLVLKP